MDTQRLTEEQIIGLLKEVEAGANISEVCRRHNIRHADYYKWRTQYGGMEADELRRLRVLDTENKTLKTLLGEAHLQVEILLRRIVALHRRLGGNGPPSPRETQES
jgi:putative transposase